MRMLSLIAIRNLLQARRRTLFLSSAIGIVTLLLVILMSLSAGVSNNLVRAATTLSAGHVNVAGFHKTTPTSYSPIINDVDEVRAIVEKATPGLDYLIDRHRGWARVMSATGGVQSVLSGIELSQEAVLLESLQLAPQSEYVDGGSGEVLGNPGRLSEPNTVLLFVSQAKRLEVDVGEVVTIRATSERGQINTLDLEVVAIARDVGLLSGFTAFVPKQVVLDLYRIKPGTSGAIQVYLHDIDDAEQAMGAIRKALAEAGYTLMDYVPQPYFFKFDAVSSEDWTGQRLDLTTWRDEVSFLVWILTALNSVSFSLVAILVAIIAIGIVNTMLISVRERTQEIGAMRAMGMQRREVLQLVLVEAVLLGAFATSGGALLGTLAAAGLDAMAIEIGNDAVRALLLSDRLVLDVEPGSVVSAVLALTFFTALSALWPAFRAARLQPVTAIQKVD